MVLAQEFGKYAFFVFFGEVHSLQINADLFSRTGRIEKVLSTRAIFAVIVVFPVFMNTPVTSYPRSLRSQALTALSTPPLMPSTTLTAIAKILEKGKTK